ncbi:MAG: hypothetical protein RLY70_2294 [Planctomycetota bacterium]
MIQASGRRGSFGSGFHFVEALREEFGQRVQSRFRVGAMGL